MHIPNGVKFQGSPSELSFQVPNPQRSKTLNYKPSVRMKLSSPMESNLRPLNTSEDHPVSSLFPGESLLNQIIPQKVIFKLLSSEVANQISTSLRPPAERKLWATNPQQKPFSFPLISSTERSFSLDWHIPNLLTRTPEWRFSFSKWRTT